MFCGYNTELCALIMLTPHLFLLCHIYVFLSFKEKWQETRHISLFSLYVYSFL